MSCTQLIIALIAQLRALAASGHEPANQGDAKLV